MFPKPQGFVYGCSMNMHSLSHSLTHSLT